MSKDLSYYERKRYANLAKENAKLQTQVTRLVGYRLHGGETNGPVQVEVVFGNATLRLKGDTRLHHVKTSDIFTILPGF